MSILLATVLASTPVPRAVPDPYSIVREASALVVPCREAAEAYFEQQDLLTYQWSASHKSRVNTLLVNGTLRIEGSEYVKVKCWLARGERLLNMKVEIKRK